MPADRTAIDVLLARFTVSPINVRKGLERFTTVNVSFHHRGNGTATHERHLKNMLGEDGLTHLYHDTWACNGPVLLWVPRYRKPDAVEVRIPLEPEHLWALGAIDDRDPEAEKVNVKLLKLLTPAVRDMVRTLPNLEVIDIRKVEVWESGRVTRKVKRRVPQDAVYFRFEGGCGLALKPKEVADAQA